jgi:hypothetical protein
MLHTAHGYPLASGFRVAPVNRPQGVCIQNRVGIPGTRVPGGYCILDTMTMSMSTIQRIVLSRVDRVNYFCFSMSQSQ